MPLLLGLWCHIVTISFALVIIIKQDRQALLKAKYCPQVAAVSCTQKTQKPTWPWHLIFWPTTLIFGRLLEVKVHVLVAAVSRRQKNAPEIHVTLTFDLWPWNSIGFYRLSRYMFTQDVIKLSAAVRELSFWQRKKTLLKTIPSSLMRTVNMVYNHPSR